MLGEVGGGRISWKGAVNVRLLRVISAVTRRWLQRDGCTDTRYQTYEVGRKGASGTGGVAHCHGAWRESLHLIGGVLSLGCSKWNPCGVFLSFDI